MTASPAEHRLFTYGVLRDAVVELDTFGREIESVPDLLAGYTVDYIDVDAHHADDEAQTGADPALRRTGNPLDKVSGSVLMVTNDELESADERENALCRRVMVELVSGRRAWVYVR